MFSKEKKTVVVLPPVADAFAGTVTSDYVNMKNFQDAEFQIVKGVGTTGTSTITVQRASASNGTGAEAIPFKYRRIAADGTPGAIQNAEAAGFTTTAGSEDVYEIFVSTSLEGLAEGSKPYVAVKGVEVVDSAVAGCILCHLTGPRYGNDESSYA